MTAMPVVVPRNQNDEALSRTDTGALAAEQLPAPAAAIAVLLGCDGRDARLDYDGCCVAARVAVSCLVYPEPGDLVGISQHGGRMWVVAVLERPSGAPLRLLSQEDIAIVSARGSVSVIAADGVAIDAGGRTLVSAREIDLHASAGRFVIDELQQIGRRAWLLVDKIRSVGEVVETFAEHVLTRARRGTRFIEESDQLRAGSVDHRAEGLLQLRAHTALVTADALVRMDAEQIHMG
jgi:Protein of unknown function (DUF3540)